MDGFSKFQRHMFTIDSKPINFYAKNLFPCLLPIASLCLRKWGEGLHIPFRIERVTSSIIINHLQQQKQYEQLQQNK